MAEDKYREIALELLDKYIDSAQTVIGEFSGDFYISRLLLEKKVKKYLKRLKAEELYEEFTKDRWIFEVQEEDTE